jgi:hypothetical protein
MATSDFSKYNLIVISENAHTDTGPAYQAAADTRAIWIAVVTGRALVQAMDPIENMIATGTTVGVTLLKSEFAWLTNGPGTALFVGSDLGARHSIFSMGSAEGRGPKGRTAGTRCTSRIRLIQRWREAPTHR